MTRGAKSASPTRRALLLTPGAGSDRDHPTLLALEAAVVPVPVERIDFPYRRAGRRAPDRAPILLGAVRDAAREFSARTEVPLGALVLGGRSMGGRMCSMVAADEEDPLGGALVLISYPLHPPGRLDRLRTEHFATLGVPCLFISGDRDPFGSPDEMEAATESIRGPVTHHWIAGKRHDIKGADEEICEVVLGWLEALE